MTVKTKKLMILDIIILLIMDGEAHLLLWNYSWFWTPMTKHKLPHGAIAPWFFSHFLYLKNFNQPVADQTNIYAEQCQAKNTEETLTGIDEIKRWGFCTCELSLQNINYLWSLHIAAISICTVIYILFLKTFFYDRPLYH